ncbi:hypothetical protein CDIK_2230 [Cucumispora dikerogammari]|nr:hypothetical protein CDIK_2230 [Cucumispora dikerogammari]
MDNSEEANNSIFLTDSKKEEFKVSLKILGHKSKTATYNSKTANEEYKRFYSLLNQTQISAKLFSDTETHSKCAKLKLTYLMNVVKSIAEQRTLLEKKEESETINESKEENDVFSQRTLAKMYEQLAMATDNTGLLDEANIGIEDLSISHKDITEKATHLKNELKISNENKKIDANNLFKAIVFGCLVMLFLVLYRTFRRLFF